jgi:hypothetical protein
MLFICHHIHQIITPSKRPSAAPRPGFDATTQWFALRWRILIMTRGLRCLRWRSWKAVRQRRLLSGFVCVVTIDVQTSSFCTYTCLCNKCCTRLFCTCKKICDLFKKERKYKKELVRVISKELIFNCRLFGGMNNQRCGKEARRLGS